MPPGCGQRLQPRRDIDAVAVRCRRSSAITSPRLTPMRNRMRRSSARSSIAVGHRALDLAGTAHRVDDAGEFRQHAVAGVLDDPAPVLRIFGSTSSREMRLEAFVRAFLIRAHQARIARHIGGEDRGETARGGGRGHCSDGANSRVQFNLLRAGSRRFDARATAGTSTNRQRHSFLRHSSLAEVGEIGLLEQCADLRRPDVLGGLQAGDGRVTIVVAEAA